MIIEIRDIINNKYVVAHSQPPPPGITLGYIFSQDPQLQQAKRYVHQVKINGAKVDAWELTSLNKDDLVTIDIVPKFEAFAAGITAIITATSLISSLVSVVMFIVNLFNRPKPTKLDAPKDSPTYSFDGIKTSFTPGGPVPPIYGEHLLGGQLLALD